MKFMKSLNTKGFGHVELVVAVLFVGLFAFVGVRVLNQSHAASLTSSQCSLLGRTWNSSTGVCNKVCAVNQGSLVVTSTYDYCSAAVTPASKISAAACTSTYGRKSLLSSSVYVGCARHAPQTAGAKYANAPQCATAGQTYYVQSTYDKCAAATTATVSGKCVIISPTTVSVLHGYSSIISRFTNIGTTTFNIAYDTEAGTSGGGGGLGHGYSGTYISAGSLAPGAYKDVTVASGASSLNSIFTGGSMGITVKNQSPLFTCSRTWSIQ